MKLRTHKTTAKRVRRTGSGKMVQTTMSQQHLRHNKSKRTLAAAKKYVTTVKGNLKRLAKLVPYS